MEFDKSKVFTALNASEVKVGSKGYGSDTIEDLKNLVTPDIIKCAECGNIIKLSKAQIKRYCLHQENNYQNCLCVSCTQKWKQAEEMANKKPSDLIDFERGYDDKR